MSPPMGGGRAPGVGVDDQRFLTRSLFVSRYWSNSSWDAGVSEHAKENVRMFVRGLLTLETEGLAIVRTPNCSLGIFYTSWCYGVWR
jgi:hypothetical protein